MRGIIPLLPLENTVSPPLKTRRFNPDSSRMSK
jgi:hypothetical protein